ncbi:major facilitator superfamily domain-containing protein [Thelonectria olida]|uniref:Major facilitator superfamily domain-containing protein n=1 Tax=Thelonectria olida TaxID=1576542 RepID=A0A9P8W667_9HYPO|nr:major facilitator superfamily domain-containing protein [Thelonectria olida]
MASPISDKPRPDSEPALTLDDEKTGPDSSTPTLFDEKPDTTTKAQDEPESEDEMETYVTGWKLTSLMISITIGAFLMLLDMSIITTAIPRITEKFHSLDDIGWYGSAYNLASAALQPLSGKLYTYFKSRWLFLGFLFVFELGCLICGVATSSMMLIIGRAVAGIGSSGIQNGAFTIMAASVPLEKRPPLMGILMGGAQLGIVLGPLVGGALTEYTTWRWCFYINLPIGAICLVCFLLVEVPDRRVKTNEPIMKTLLSKLDLTGFALFAPCTVMFLLALQWGGTEYPWDSAKIIGLFCGGGGLLLVFLYWEYRVGDLAMIPLPVIRKRQIWTSCVTMLFLFTSVFIAAYYLPVYFQSVKGVSPFTSGVNLLPSILSQLVSAVIIGVVGDAVIVTIANGLLSTLGPHTSTAKWAGYQVFIGIGRGIGMQMPILALQANSSPDIISIATAVLVFSQTFGGAVFISVSNVIFNNKLKDELESRLPDLDADTIINAGATAALAAYAKSVDAVFYLAIAASGLIIYTRICTLQPRTSLSTMNRPNRPKNRQPRPERQNHRGPPRQFRGSPATPQQATGTVPTVQQVIPGAPVFIILKEDQPTGEETYGLVQDVLTRGNHPRGIKVRLRDGQVGRVQRMGSGSATAPVTEERSAPAPSSSTSRFTNRYTDVRYDDEFPDGPPARSLADFMPEVEEPRQSETGVATGVAAVKCPFCEEFEGDEVAVTHHIDREHLT